MIKRFSISGLLLLSIILSCFSQDNVKLDKDGADDLARLALNCIQKEYPNKPGEVLSEPSDVMTPQEMHPAFYGCFDWHSSVHGHWMLVKLLKEFPDMLLGTEIKESLSSNITKENIQKEIEYFYKPLNKNFERTYGWAWLLKLSMELESWDDDLGKELSRNLQPLTDSIVNKYMNFLPKLIYPIRVGEHTNTAFGLSFAWDYAVFSKNIELQELISNKAREFYFNDFQCPINWEPGGFDFISPCLMEADLMTRILDKKEFNIWIKQFMAGLQEDEEFDLEPGIVTDRTDGKLVHIDGLNFSRAWCLYNIAKKTDSSKKLKSLADAHFNHSFTYISSGDYMGEHWLASFAVYAFFSR